MCRLLGVTKQAYYKHGDSDMLKAAQESFVVEFIKDIRKKDPGIGGNKLWLMYQRQFGISRSVGSCQLIVSDITYIPYYLDPESGEYKFCYLALITDYYTKEIVGYSVAPTLEAIYAIEALKMALDHYKGNDLSQLIHHSDRGVQYASYQYTDLLKKYGIKISMTETGNPKDNAVAERVNNTIKNELLKGMSFTSMLEVSEAVKAAIRFYNEERPHLSLDGLTPREAAKKRGEFDKKWISYREKAIKAKVA
ncbi:IS3 family transposase [Prevotella sp.]|nr:IS3 family transposase [Prevotella sp.]